MTENSDAGRRTERRSFMKAVGAAGAAAAVSSTAGAAAPERVLDDALEPSRPEPQDALVVFDDPDRVDRLSALSLSGDYHAFEVLPVGYASLTGDQLREVAGWDSVRRISADHEITYRNDDSQEDTGAREVWEREDLGYRGENVEVAIIDGGLDGKHPGHVNNIAGNYQWVGDPTAGEVFWVDTQNAQNDDLGHGTHCAGSLAGDGTGSLDGNYAGMAPDASIHAYSFVVTGATIATAVAAYDHMIAGKRQGDNDIQLVTNSWGYPGGFEPWDPVPVAAYWAFKDSIISFWAAGNQGEDGVKLRDTQPAPFLVSVVAATADQAVADFSTRGHPDRNHDRKTALDNIVRLYEEGLDVEDVDGPIGCYRSSVLAKGAGVMSTESPEQPLYGVGAAGSDSGQLTEPLYAPLSGTSMASPTAAGCAALFLDAYVDEHDEFPDPIDTINTLEATTNPNAHPDGPGSSEYSTRYTRLNAGTGYVDIEAAVERAVADDLAGFEEVELPPVGELPPSYD